MTAFGLVSPIVLEFVFGMICAKLYLMGVGRSISPTAFIVGALWLVLTVWFRFEIDTTWLWGIPAFLVVFGVVGISQANNRLLIYLGDASYSIYLTQVFTIAVFYKIFSKFLAFQSADMFACLALISTAIVGCLFYRYVERPIGLALKKYTSRSLNVVTAPELSSSSG